jgi:restriction endonuclease S subunit
MPGDIFVVKSSGSNTNIISGKLGLVTQTMPRVVFSNFLMRVRPNARVVPSFLAYLLRSELTRERIQRMVATTTYPNIDVPEYVGSFFALPAVAEQTDIVVFLDREAARTDALVARVRDAIDRLKELHTALISAAVTGKIDVREESA